MLASSAKCSVFKDTHYLFLSGHVHRVLNTNSPVPETDLRATLCEVSNADHTSSVPRALVLNLPSPSPLITYEFLVLHRASPSPILFCTGVMYRPADVDLKRFGEMLFTCGPGGVCGNREACDEHLQTIQRLAAPSRKDSEKTNTVVIDARFFELLVNRVVPSNVIGVWLETIAFRRYFLTQNVLRAMCYADALQSRMLHGKEQAIQSFMKRVEEMDRPVDHFLLSKFHSLNDPSQAFSDAISSDLALSKAATAVLQCYPRTVHVGDGSAAKCKEKHDLAASSPFLDTYSHLSDAVELLELAHTRHTAGMTLTIGKADCVHRKAACVKRLGDLGCLSVHESDPGRLKLDWPTCTPPLLDSMPLSVFTTIIDRKDFNGDVLLKFYDESKLACDTARSHGKWNLAAATDTAEKHALLCISFATAGALFLHVATSVQREKHGETSVCMLDYPMSAHEISQALTSDGSQTIVGCVLYGSAHVVRQGLTWLSDVYVSMCETYRLVPRILWIR